VSDYQTVVSARAGSDVNVYSAPKARPATPHAGPDLITPRETGLQLQSKSANMGA
jgi:hypothetical protein